MQVRLTALDSNGQLLALSPTTQVSIKAQTDDATKILETFLPCAPSQGELICTLPKSQLSDLCASNACGTSTYPNLISVQAVVQSLMSASTEFSPNDPLVPFVKSTESKVGTTTTGDFNNWTFIATFGGLCPGAKNPKATLSDGTTLNGSQHGSDKTYAFEITLPIFKLLTDDMPIAWTCTNAEDSKTEATIVGLAKSLTPQISAVTTNETVLRGKFSGVTGLRVNADTPVPGAVVSPTSIYVPNGYAAKGLLYMMVGDMSVPAVLQGDQIVIEQTGSVNDPRFVIAGSQTVPPSGSGGAAAPSGTNTAGNASNPPNPKSQTPEEIAAAKDEANKKAALEAATKQMTGNVQIVTNK
jgi:hypothetical protein